MIENYYSRAAVYAAGLWVASMAALVGSYFVPDVPLDFASVLIGLAAATQTVHWWLIRLATLIRDRADFDRAVRTERPRGI
jgi:hypothetical protein